MSLRLRLTTWYAALLGLALLVFSLLLYYMMSGHLYNMIRASGEHHAWHITDTFEATSISPEAWLQPSSQEWQQLQALLRALETPGLYTEIITPDGTLLASGNPHHITVPTAGWALDKAAAGAHVRYDDQLADGRFVTVLVRPLSSNPPLILQVAADHAEAQVTLRRLQTILLGGSALLMIVALAIGSSVAREALSPISNMIDTARAIASSRGFGQRIKGVNRTDELGHLAATFNDMLASLEEAHALQQRFLADASHELRAPLAVIRGNLELLERQAELGESDRNAMLADVRSETARMSRLIDDLLSLARADAGLKMQRVKVELDAVIIAACRALRNQARDHHLKLEPIEPLVVRGDHDRVQQLVMILVENALAYTPPGGQITIGLQAADGHVTLTVVDTGVGIAPEDLPHIFERFYRADKARSRSQAGTGLGLAIARWIVEQHGGNIQVQSGVGSGTTFAIQLPLDA